MKILLHICCGVCLSYPAEKLLEEGHEVVGFYFNPNIHPQEENDRRLEAAKITCDFYNLDIIYSDACDQDPWEEFKGDMDQRCRMCYETRLYETAKYAKEHGFDAFCTTLSSSIYQDVDAINDVMQRMGQLLGVEPLCRDFREGYYVNRKKAFEHEIYRQKYCGCICSLNGNGR